MKEHSKKLAPPVMTRNSPVDTAKELCLRRPKPLIHYRGDFYEWRDNHYHKISNEAVRAEIYTFLEGALTKTQTKGPDGEIKWEKAPFHPDDRAVQKVFDALRHLERTVYISDELDAPCWLRNAGDKPDAKNVVPLSDCLLDLESGEPFGNTSDFLTFTALPFAFDPEAKCERWQQFTDELFGEREHTKREFQKAVGYMLSGDCSQQKIFLVKGPARSGKGTILRVLAALLGRENVINPKLSELREHFGRQQLIGKRAAFFPDERLDGKTSSIVEWLLSISGEDDVSIARKNQVNWHGRLGVRCWIATNITPGFEDASAVIASRFIMFKLDRSFAGKEDTTLTEKLLAELPGILNWAIAGLAMLREDGCFIQPEEAQDDLEQMGEIASPVKAFCNERLIFSESAACPVKDLFKAYAIWCEIAKHEAMSRTKFRMTLGDLLPDVKLHRQGGRGAQTWVAEGVRLRKAGDGEDTASLPDDPMELRPSQLREAA